MKSVLAIGKTWATLAFLAAAPIAINPASAQTYPSASIKFIVPYPAGGAGDMVARLVGEKLAAALNTSVVVINRPGAGGCPPSETRQTRQVSWRPVRTRPG